MTGSLLLNRQHSSTAGYPSKKMARPKLRRCSSADEHNSFDVIPDENQNKKTIFTKHDPTSSDNDSGIEDFDQQNATGVHERINNVDEEEPSLCFGACEDENFEENSTENFIQIDAQRIYNDIHLAAKVPHEEKKRILFGYM